MESKMFKTIDNLERSGWPLWELPLPRVSQNRPPGRVSVPDPDNPNLKGWTCQRRIYAFSGCIRYYKRVDLISTLLDELCMSYHPRWAQEGAALLPAGELPEIELAIVDIGMRALADNWSCQDTIRDEDQLRYFRAELPGYIFLTKLFLALREVAEKLRSCLGMIKTNTESIRRRVGHRYREHKRCYESAEPAGYRGLASGKESPLRNAVEFDPGSESASQAASPAGEVSGPGGVVSGSAEGQPWDSDNPAGEWGSSESWGRPGPDDTLGARVPGTSISDRWGGEGGDFWGVGVEQRMGDRGVFLETPSQGSARSAVNGSGERGSGSR